MFCGGKWVYANFRKIEKAKQEIEDLNRDLGSQLAKIELKKKQLYVIVRENCFTVLLLMIALF
jgi:hypothetical protein